MKNKNPNTLKSKKEMQSSSIVKNDKNVIECINTIYNSAKDSELSLITFKDLQHEIKIVSGYLKCTTEEAFYFSVITTMNLYGDQVDLSDLCRYLNSSPFNLMADIKHITSLAEKKILLKRPQRHRGDDIMRMHFYIAAPDILEALINGTDCPDQSSKIFTGTLDVIENLYVLANECIEGSMLAKDMIQEMNVILSENQKFKFIYHLSQMDISDVDRMILVYSIWKTLAGSNQVDIDQAIESFNGFPAKRVRYIQSMFSGNNPLISNELIEVKPARFFSDLEIEVTYKTSEMLEQDGIKMLKPKRKNNTINPSDISTKELFYNPEEAEQVDRLRDMMMEENYSRLIERLKDKRLPLCLNALLFGAPGTGKTETVLQLARFTNREIMKVEISQTKSMWFGESEKLIKKIFKDYEELRINSKTTPILLFNEADAILGKRRINSNSNTGQTENAIQNILLEELENFNGIFMATTNLADNLDKAFDRRFLFKVCFSKPDIKSKSAIWKNKLPQLDTDETARLAEQFDLTGGQIDNIVRKCEITSVIDGEYPPFSSIFNYCLEETVLNRTNKNVIGFKQ